MEDSVINTDKTKSINPKSLKNLRPFKKGQSGNPNGRPPKDCSITSLIKEMLDLPCDAAIPGAKDGKTWRQLVARAILYGAAKGNPAIVRELLERLEGRVTQVVGGESGRPIQHIISVIDNETKVELENYLNE